MKYNNLVIKHFFEPNHVGRVEPSATEKLIYHSQSQSGQGDRIELFLAVDGNSVIGKVAFLAYGNPYLLAAGSLLCSQLQGKVLSKNLGYNFNYFVDILEIPTTKLYVAILLEEALNHCVRQLV